ncbi:unnamed protein product [Victoria cruziana]
MCYLRLTSTICSALSAALLGPQPCLYQLHPPHRSTALRLRYPSPRTVCTKPLQWVAYVSYSHEEMCSTTLRSRRQVLLQGRILHLHHQVQFRLRLLVDIIRHSHILNQTSFSKKSDRVSAPAQQ